MSISSPSLTGFLSSNGSSMMNAERTPPSQDMESNPMCIVGAGLRLPGGVNDMDSLWSSLQDTSFDPFKSPCSSTPSYNDNARRGGRWPTGAVSPDTKMALIDVDGFDAPFFHVAPQEALALRPQTRLLLETAYEALESAGEKPSQMRGERVAVYTACAEDGYMMCGEASRGEEFHTRFLHLSRSNSTIAGRLSFFFDWTGPSQNVDTACSSGLTVLHLAIRSIEAGDADQALVCAATTHLWPDTIRFLESAGILSKSGVCAPFSQEADGYNPSEGAICLLIKPKRAALAHGNKILAEICGSALGHSGRSPGLMRPTPSSQIQLLHRALANAHLSPSELDIVEAHGTGTKLGDEVELEALHSVFGKKVHPLLVSSAKSRFGHGHEVAGLLGVLKAILQGQNLMVPAHGKLHHPKQLDPSISGYVDVVNTARRLDGPSVITGVSSFGYAGSIAHCILRTEMLSTHSQQAILPLNTIKAASPSILFTVSAQSQAALVELLQRHSDTLASNHALAQVDGPLFPAYCLAANLSRDHFRHRAALLVSPGTDASAKIKELSNKVQQRSAESTTCDAKLTFVFTGHGSKMTPELHKLWLGFSPIYTEAIQSFEQVMLEVNQTHFSMQDTLVSELDELASSGFVLFAFQYAIATVLKHLGISPAAVVGCSLGEWPAAVVAGALSLQSAVAMLSARVKHLNEAANHTSASMVAVRAQPLVAQEVLLRAGLFGYAEVSVKIQPGITTFAVTNDHLDIVTQAWKAAGVSFSQRSIPHAFHSRHVQSVADAMLQQAKLFPLGDEERVSSIVDYYSGVTGSKLPAGSRLDISYWAQHIRQPCQFLDAAQSALQDDKSHPSPIWLDLSPDRATFRAIQKLCQGSNVKSAAIAPLASSEINLDGFLGCMAKLYEEGCFDPNETLPKLATDLYLNVSESMLRSSASHLPRYPFQRRTYWPSVGPKAVHELLQRYCWEEQPSSSSAVTASTAPSSSTAAPSSAPTADLSTSYPTPSRCVLQWDENANLTVEGDTADHTVLVVTNSEWKTSSSRTKIVGPSSDLASVIGQWISSEEGQGQTIFTIILALDLNGASQELGLHTAFDAVHAVLSLSKSSIKVRLAGITRGLRGTENTVQDREDSLEDELSHATLFGFLKTARTELAGRLDVCVLDLPTTWPIADVERVAISLATSPASYSTSIHLIRGSPSAPRYLQPVFRERDVSIKSPRAHTNLSGTYIVVGGTGDVGAQLVPWLASLGVQRIIIVGQRVEEAVWGRLELIKSRVQGRAEIIYSSCDCSQQVEVEKLVDYAGREEKWPLKGIVHLAARIADSSIIRHSWETFVAPLSDKVHSAWHLHNATLNHPIETFLLFSSGSSSYGNPGQSNYVAANTFLEQLAIGRRARGRPALCILLGPWLESAKAKMISKPLLLTFPMAPHSKYLPAFEASLAVAQREEAIENSVVLLIPISRKHLALQMWAKNHQWTELIQGTAAIIQSTPAPSLQEPAPQVSLSTVPVPAAMSQTQVSNIATPQTKSTSVASTNKKMNVRDTIATALKSLLLIDEDTQVDWQAGFTDLGMDSLSFMTFTQHMSGITGAQLPMTFLDCEQMEAIVQWYDSQV